MHCTSLVSCAHRCSPRLPPSLSRVSARTRLTRSEAETRRHGIVVFCGNARRNFSHFASHPNQLKSDGRETRITEERRRTIRSGFDSRKYLRQDRRWISRSELSAPIDASNADTTIGALLRRLYANNVVQYYSPIGRMENLLPLVVAKFSEQIVIGRAQRKHEGDS